MERITGPGICFLNLQLPEMHPVQAVWGDDVTNSFPRHVHQALTIGVLDRGVRLLRHEGTSALIPAGRLFVINPGASHSCRSRDPQGHSYRVVCVDPETVADTAAQISGKAPSVPYFPHPGLDDPELVRRVRRFFSLMEQPGSALKMESLFLSLISRLLLRHGQKPPVPRPLGPQRAAMERVGEFIRAQYARNLTLAQLSRVACLSPFHLQRLFVKEKGVSPHDYLAQVRITKARELLRQGHSLAGAALDTGFADQSHFTHCFKRLMGISPGRYLRLSKP